MVGSNSEVSRIPLDHGQHRREHTAHRANLLTIHIFRRGHRKKMPEQFISPVDQVCVHFP